MPLRRLLAALDCPLVLDLADGDSVLMHVCWLEDLQIRCWEIDKRATLRTPGPHWDGAFSEYLADVGCALPWPGDAALALAWLAGKAVDCKYEEDEEALRRDTGVFLASRRSRENGAPDGDAAVARLCGGLGLAVAEDDGALLAAVAAASATRQDAKGALPLDAGDYPLGFSTGDPTCDEVSARIRLLLLVDLRSLQSDVNRMLALAQNFVADPKTDTKLGKVGR
ncbi:putative carnitine deficiency-associated protein-domain-containing protein [Pelagophyceae sp. CCMP2097]|nr:putative carnitine deficiency-associated protein-domain-containing protein [Pelagophyceae sp. CCMP2097]|mmetsp:Transcript_1782/g.5319  ORF Transcript_1782/g.5319 Transcript_1782/m.5319 type:complete len:225 (+) Transcript_1782:55-729(+)